MASDDPSSFEDLTVETQDGATVLTHVHEDRIVQAIAMGVSTLLFVIFVIVGLPALELDRTGNAIFLVVGLLMLAAIGLSTQARTRTTRIRIDAVGVEIEQGTPIDREAIHIAWGEIAAIELEPIDPKRAEKGMQLRIALRQGAPADTLRNVSAGDLMATRRLMLNRLQQFAAAPRA